MDNEISLELLKSGDTESFAALVKLCEKKVYNLALRYTNNEADALDVSQEVFLRVWKALPNFKGESALTTWVYRIAVNTSIDLTRKRARQNEMPLVVENRDGEETEAVLPDSSYSPEEEYAKTERREVLKDAITRLDDDYRTVIIMRDIEDMSYSDIAEALEVSEGTVKSRLFRAREKLRKDLTARNFFPSVSSKNQKGGHGNG